MGANASLATRIMLCSATTPSESDDEDEDFDDGGDGTYWGREEDCAEGNRGQSLDIQQQPRRDEEGRDGFELEANATLVSSLSSAISGGSGAKGISARIAAAQKQASTNITSSPSDNSRARAAAAAATNASSSIESTPPPFHGRSLMSAEWVSKRGGGAVGRRGRQRYATKALTPGSWTATEDPSSEGGLGATAGQGVPSSGASGDSVGLGSGAGYFSSPQGGGNAASNKSRGDRVTKRGLGRGWEGLYQVRSFEDTPDGE